MTVCLLILMKLAKISLRWNRYLHRSFVFCIIWPDFSTDSPFLAWRRRVLGRSRRSKGVTAKVLFCVFYPRILSNQFLPSYCEHYRLDPVILDACLHILIHPSITGTTDKSVYYLPSRCDRFFLYNEVSLSTHLLFAYGSKGTWTPGMFPLWM